MHLFLFALLAIAPAEKTARVQYVVTELVEAGYERKEAEALFKDPRLTTVSLPKGGNSITWRTTALYLLSEEMVTRGKAYFEENRAIFEEAEQTYGISASTLTGLIGLESAYSENTGKYVVWNTFYTMLLSPRATKERWRWATKNLVALAKYAKIHKEDVYGIKGSWAGAIGIVQFLPINLLEFGVDHNHDGKVDLYALGDAVMSAANLLKANGWNKDALTQKSAISMYYCGVGYETEKARERGGRAYTDLVLFLAEAITRDLTALLEIVNRASSRFPLRKT